MTDTKKNARDAAVRQAETLPTYPRLAVTLGLVASIMRDALDLPIFGIDLRLEEWLHVSFSVLASRCEGRARALSDALYRSGDWDSHELTQLSARLDALRSCVNLWEASELASELEEAVRLLDGACHTYRWTHQDDVRERLTAAYSKGRAEMVATLTEEEIWSALTPAQKSALDSEGLSIGGDS